MATEDQIVHNTRRCSTCLGIESADASDEDGALFLLSDKEQFGQASVESGRVVVVVVVVVEGLGPFDCFWCSAAKQPVQYSIWVGDQG